MLQAYTQFRFFLISLYVIGPNNLAAEKISIRLVNLNRPADNQLHLTRKRDHANVMIGGDVIDGIILNIETLRCGLID